MLTGEMAAGMMTQQTLKDKVQTSKDELKQLKSDDDLVKQRENRISQMMRVMESWDDRYDLKIEQLEKRLQSRQFGFGGCKEDQLTWSGGCITAWLQITWRTATWSDRPTWSGRRKRAKRIRW